MKHFIKMKVLDNTDNYKWYYTTSPRELYSIKDAMTIFNISETILDEGLEIVEIKHLTPIVYYLHKIFSK